MDGLLDEDDLKLVKELKQKYQQAKAKTSSSSSSSGPHGGPSGSSSGGSGDLPKGSGVAGSEGVPHEGDDHSAFESVKKLPIKHVVAEALDVDLDELKARMPLVKGCRLNLDTVWHNRFVATYPNDSPPFSCSCVFGPMSKRKLTVHQAYMEALKWAWTCHLEKDTTAECPYDLD